MAELTLDEIRQALSSLPQCVAEAEAGYTARVGELAEQVIARGSRVVLLAGPSSSGKTTTSNLLADRLRQEGRWATVISLDDFYFNIGDPAYPRNSKGEPDYESPYSLDLSLLRQVMGKILSGEEVKLPRFDFRLGRRTDNATTVKIPEGGCAIFEGLHALNPVLTEGLNCDGVTRVFISVSTNILNGGERILSGRKIRFLRRLSRDYLYRASDAARTLAFWEGVLEGEDKHLYPYRDTAHISFDTFHLYEVGVLAGAVKGILEEAKDLRDPYLDEVRRGVAFFDPLPQEIVPQNSLLREFIVGGVYEHLY